MENLSETELKELLYFNKRLLSLIDLTAEYKNDIKALKICLKLIACQKSAVEKRKTTLKSEDINGVIRDYEDLIKHCKAFKSAKKPEMLTDTAEELNRLKEKTENTVKAIETTLNPEPENEGIISSISSKAQKLGEKIEKGAQKFSDAVAETVEELKKKISENN